MRLPISVFAVLIMFFMGQPLANGQDGVIELYNPSFEDQPMNSRPPRGWKDCGFPGESPPDTQPDPTFQVTKQAQDGNTYLGLVARENDTWEAVAQRLSEPLKKGTCYDFSMFLCRSELYVSLSRLDTDRDVNYTTPAKLRIYGGFDYCDKQYLLAETKEIISFRWLQYNFKLEPIADYTHIIFEVFYKTPTLFPYNGNILLDNASPLQPMPCNEEELIAEAEEEEEETEEIAVVEQLSPKTSNTPDPPKVETPEEKTTPTPAPPPVVEPTPAEVKPASIADLKREDLREGQTIRIDRLFFGMDKAIIDEGSYSVLSEVYLFMSRNPDVLIEIGGHTNGLCSTNYCNQLSADRAEAVADYLMGRGVSPQRLSHKGYGKTIPIATNSTAEGRKQNQRVEIKILGFSN